MVGATMRPSEPEANLYHATSWPLLTFVHEQTGLMPELCGHKPSDPMSSAQAMVLRDRLWAGDSLREAFLARTPGGLGGTRLERVGSWKRRQEGP